MLGSRFMCCPRCGSENLIKAFSWKHALEKNPGAIHPRISCVGCYWAIEDTGAVLFEMVCRIEYENLSNDT